MSDSQVLPSVARLWSPPRKNEENEDNRQFKPFKQRIKGRPYLLLTRSVSGLFRQQLEKLEHQIVKHMVLWYHLK